MQLDLGLPVLGHDDRVIEFKQIVALKSPQRQPDFLGFKDVGIRDCNELGHEERSFLGLNAASG
jgi:hypothetical protein